MGNYYYRQPCRVCIALLLIPGVSPVTSLKLVAGSMIESLVKLDLTSETVACCRNMYVRPVTAHVGPDITLVAGKHGSVR